MARELAVAGVDIGGTKTHIRFATGALIVVDDVCRTGEWRTSGNVADAERVMTLAQRAHGRGVLAGIAIGAHGCDSAYCDRFEQRLRTLNDYPVRVVNYAELFAPATNLSDGIELVAGADLIAVTRRADNAMLVADGWGWILGDEGSAVGLVREAVRAVLESIDRAQPRETLYDALCRSLGVGSETKFGRKSESIRGAAGFSRHADAVFAAAAAGSRLAYDVIREGARALALLVRRIVDRGASFRRVVAAGGGAQQLLLDFFERELKTAVPDATALLLRTPPVAGAVVLAEHLVAGTSSGSVSATAP